MKKIITIIAFFALLTIAPSFVRAEIIDTFEDGAVSKTWKTEYIYHFLKTDLEDVIGGERYMSVGASAKSSMNLTLTGEDDGLAISTPAGGHAWAVVEYTPENDDFDLNQDGANTFQISFSQDPGVGEFKVYLDNNGDNYTGFTLNGSGTYLLPYTAFGVPESTFSQLDFLSWSYKVDNGTGTSPSTVVLSDIRTIYLVPEPNTWTLLGFVCLGLVFFAQRKVA